jgi:hypothetical protein
VTEDTNLDSQNQALFAYRVSIFPDLSGQRCHFEELDTESFINRLYGKPGPLLKLARFGDVRTDKGSLRHDGNIVAIYGVEGDCDSGKLSPQEAVERLRDEGIRCVVYTTKSHKPESPRWRVLAPTSRTISPQRNAIASARCSMAS